MMSTTTGAVHAAPYVETGDAKGTPERGTSAPRSLVEYDDYGIEQWALSQTSAGKPYSYRDVLRDAKGAGSPKRYQPGRTWQDGKRNAGSGGGWGFSAERDYWHGEDAGHRIRRARYGGKRADDQRVTMPRGTWHVHPTARWSVAATVCAVCSAEMEPDGKRRYCSAECRRAGSNAVRRAKRAVKWPTDEHGWYLQQPFPQRRRRLKVHTFTEWEVAQTQTISGDYRLRQPWHGQGQLYAWKVAKLTA